MPNLKYYFFITTLVITLNAIAQPYSTIVSISELAKQKKVLVEDYPRVFNEEEINNIEKIDSKHSKIFYTRNGIHFEAIVNSDRKDLLLIATFEEISKNDLPKIVLYNFQNSNDGKSKIENAFIGTTPYTSDFYRIDIIEKTEKGNSVKSLFYDELGKYMVPPY